MLLAAILVSALLLRRSAAAASVSGRWRRLDGLKEGDFNLKKAVGGEFFWLFVHDCGWISAA